MADLTLLTGAVDDLREADVKADLDLADVRVPGVWVRLRSIEHESMDGDDDTLVVEAIAIVKDRDPARNYADLAKLYDQTKAVLGVPDGPARIVSVNSPEGGTLPGLAIPFQLVP